MNQAPNNFSITSAHHGVFEDVAKSILSSLIGSMNFRAVAYARMHLRMNALENGQRAKEVAGYKRISGDELNIDDRADADAAIAEAANREQASPDFGFNIQMSPSELAKSMMILRDFFAQRIESIGIKSQRDKPGSIAETIQYQLDRGLNGEAQTKAQLIAEALDIDPAMLSAAMLEDHTRDVNDLRANAGKVITYLEQFGGNSDSDVDETTAEHTFDALPAHVQYKIIAKVIAAYEKQAKYQLIKLSRGNMDAASNYKMLKSVREDAVVWLKTFSLAKRQELNEYLDRGGDLPEFSDEVVTSNDARPNTQQSVVGMRAEQNTQAALARQSEDAAAREAEILAAREPKVIGKAQRAPKPKKADAAV